MSGLGFAAVCVFGVCMVCDAAAEPDWNKIQAEAKTHLINLVGINTAQPEGNELEGMRYVYRVLSDENIDWTIYRAGKSRANLVARLKGEGKEKPLLLLAHMDTVGADARDWHTPPFSAVEKDGYIYGRGAADCKDLISIELMTLVALKRSGVKLNRDVILAVLADEEAGGRGGLRWLMENHWDELAAGFAINEGGGMIADEKGNPQIVVVDTAEKMYLDIKITARGAAAHSAAPPVSDHAIYRLAGALGKIEAYKPQYRLSPLAKDFFRAIYPLQDTDAKTTLDMLLSANPVKEAQAAEAVSLDPFFNSQIRDTLTPTIISGGSDANVTPSRAEAVINCRLLPDSDPDKFIAGIKALVADENISLTVLEEPRVPFPPPMPTDNDFFRTIVLVSSESFAGAKVIGGLVSGATGSEFLRRRGVITYGLGGAYNAVAHIHGVDERIPVDEFYRQLRFIYEVTRRFSAAE